ncbi:hypothetical protein [Negadavirga shengliensis]|uniref:Uncharacterized protein n=1 Tax=Negadavirga shengliensis TaxID=1389218 RepID=A0ABV9SX78_9BACT
MAFSSNDRTARSDLEALSKDLEQFKAYFREQVGHEISQVTEAAKEFRLLTQDDLVELAGRIEILVDQLQNMLGELREREGFALSQPEAIQLASTVNTLQVELDSLIVLFDYIETELNKQNATPQSFVGRAFQAVQRSVSSLRSFIKPIIQRIAQRLWRLISGLLTPKEWSIGGELGNTVWGLSKVKLEIKFGP